ncbi:MAG: hypothetical protein H6739_23460 [Alphaproteobacteria bacterium]|nr:hypothetical protein [Alphaproteobacteria bacterium]
MSEHTVPAKDILWLRKNLEEQLYRAFQASFPLFSYKELKSIVKSQYYRLIQELRESYTWEELQQRTATTQQGLRKLGDIKSPRLGDNEIRRVLLIVQDGGEQGLSIGELAARFYEESQVPQHRISLDEALMCLLDTGDIICAGRRYYAGKPELDFSSSTIRRLLILLQQHPDGLTLEQLAARFYSEQTGPDADVDFDGTLECLIEVGDVIEQGGRLFATGSEVSYAREGGVSRETVMSILNTAGRIGDVVVRNGGNHTAGLWRVTVNVRDDLNVHRQFVLALKNAVAGVIDEVEAEATGDRTQIVTVILGTAPSIN